MTDEIPTTENYDYKQGIAYQEFCVFLRDHSDKEAEWWLLVNKDRFDENIRKLYITEQTKLPIRDWIAQVRKENYPSPVQESSHLLTDNPPLSLEADRGEAIVGILGFLFVAGISFFVELHSLIAHKPFTRYDFIILCVGFVNVIFCLQLETRYQKLKKKWKTVYHTISYQFANKSATYSLDVQIEIPEIQNTNDVYWQLKNCVSGPLSALFADPLTIPTREAAWECIERAMAIKQREIDLHILRMEIVGFSDKSAQASKEIPQLWT